MATMAFGAWEGRWGWRVEWYEGDTLKYQDFYQQTLKPGLDKAEADEFRNNLKENVA